MPSLGLSGEYFWVFCTLCSLIAFFLKVSFKCVFYKVKHLFSHFALILSLLYQALLHRYFPIFHRVLSPYKPRILLSLPPPPNTHFSGQHYPSAIQWLPLLCSLASLERPWCWVRLKAKGRKGLLQDAVWLDSTADSMSMNLGKLRDTVNDKGAWCAAVHGLTKVGHNLVTEQEHPVLSLLCSPLPSQRTVTSCPSGPMYCAKHMKITSSLRIYQNQNIRYYPQMRILWVFVSMEFSSLKKLV